MKAVFPSKEIKPTLDSRLEPILGNAKSYVIIGDDPNNFIVLINEASEKECVMAKKFKELDVDAVVSCKLCQHCLVNLKKLSIDAWKCDGSRTIRESWSKFTLGGIFPRQKPDIVLDCKHKTMITNL